MFSWKCCNISSQQKHHQGSYLTQWRYGWNKQWMTKFKCKFIWLLLFGCFFSSFLKIFHSFGDVTITDKKLQILTYMYAQHSGPLSSEGSWTCHTYCDMGQPIIMAISKNPWSGAATTYFNKIGLSWLGFQHPTYSLRGKHSNRLRHHRGCVNSTTVHVNVHITQIGIASIKFCIIHS